MSGRKKVTEETITTEERMGTEMQKLDGAEMLSVGDAAAEGDGMDMNELLESMDREPEETEGQEDGLPELSEEDMFGETAAETEGDGTVEAGTVSEAASETTAEDRQPEKPKRASRRKKADGQSTEETAADDSVEEISTVEQAAAEDNPMEQISIEEAGEDPMEGGHSMEEDHSTEEISIQETEEQTAGEDLDEDAPIEGEDLSGGDLAKKCWEIHRRRRLTVMRRNCRIVKQWMRQQG